MALFLLLSCRLSKTRNQASSLAGKEKEIMTQSILFVDDEEHILKSLRRLFIHTEYETFYAIGGKEALDILEREKIDLIISDMRMPEINGYQLLKEVRQKYPATMRVILSGYAEEKEIIKALQDGSTRMYLMKPWDNEKLLKIIEQLLIVGQLFKDKKVLEIINSIDGLPTLPAVYRKVCNLIEENAEIETIAKVIEDDQVIAAKVLQIANSVFYGLPTGSVKQAIVFLGLSNIKNIVLSISIIQNKICNNTLFSQEMLWRHVSITNKIVHLIYEKLLQKKIPDVCATAGLLHDMGKIILVQNFPQQYQQVVDRLKCERDTSICDIENEILQVSHQEIGGFLLNWWGMPQSIIEAAIFHHTPFDKRVIDREVVGVVHIADYYSWQRVGRSILPILDKDIFAALGIKQEDCEQLIKTLKTDC